MGHSRRRPNSAARGIRDFLLPQCRLRVSRHARLLGDDAIPVTTGHRFSGIPTGGWTATDYPAVRELVGAEQFPGQQRDLLREGPPDADGAAVERDRATGIAGAHARGSGLRRQPRDAHHWLRLRPQPARPSVQFPRSGARRSRAQSVLRRHPAGDAAERRDHSAPSGAPSLSAVSEYHRDESSARQLQIPQRAIEAGADGFREAWDF